MEVALDAREVVDVMGHEHAPVLAHRGREDGVVMKGWPHGGELESLPGDKVGEYPPRLLEGSRRWREHCMASKEGRQEPVDIRLRFTGPYTSLKFQPYRGGEVEAPEPQIKEGIQREPGQAVPPGPDEDVGVEHPPGHASGS